MIQTRSLTLIRERPHLGVAIAYGFRGGLVRRLPVGLVYAVDGEAIVVVAVAHQRRSPTTGKEPSMTANSARGIEGLLLFVGFAATYIAPYFVQLVTWEGHG